MFGVGEGMLSQGAVCVTYKQWHIKVPHNWEPHVRSPPVSVILSIGVRKVRVLGCIRLLAKGTAL